MEIHIPLANGNRQIIIRCMYMYVCMYVRHPLNLVDSSDFLPLIFIGSDTPGEHPKPLKNHIQFLVFSHFSFIFWCGLLYLGHWAENQQQSEKKLRFQFDF